MQNRRNYTYPGRCIIQVSLRYTLITFEGTYTLISIEEDIYVKEKNIFLI